MSSTSILNILFNRIRGTRLLDQECVWENFDTKNLAIREAPHQLVDEEVIETPATYSGTENEESTDPVSDPADSVSFGEVILQFSSSSLNDAL
jgi:hypothetical protein